MISHESPTLNEVVYRLEQIRRINEQMNQFSSAVLESGWDDFMRQQLILQKRELLDKLDSTLLALNLKPVLEELLQTHP